MQLLNLLNVFVFFFFPLYLLVKSIGSNLFSSGRAFTVLPQGYINSPALCHDCSPRGPFYSIRHSAGPLHWCYWVAWTWWWESKKYSWDIVKIRVCHKVENKYHKNSRVYHVGEISDFSSLEHVESSLLWWNTSCCIWVLLPLRKRHSTWWIFFFFDFGGNI